MIVGTAGHIDHGKTTLVRALTGVDTDRLPQEKARGISIELGYAFLDVPDASARIGFIDVPGHERLVHTMLAGATGIDAALLLVAADDGVMPQTREHLAVLSLLGISRGVVVITKADRADAARLAQVRSEVAASFANSSLAGAPVLAVSAVSGDGLDALRAQLARLAGETPRAAGADAGFRLAVDRVFTLPGVGTVATGTVHAGRVRVGDEVALAPSPSAMRARVRSVHAQNLAVGEAVAGQRCAVALVGIAKDELARGDWLVAPGLALATQRIDAAVTLWHAEARALRSGAPVHVHIGAADVTGSVAVLQRFGSAEAGPADAMRPGESAWVQLVLARPVAAWYGDRVVLRDAAASRTIAGGRVLDPFAPARYRRSPQRLAELAAWSAPTPAERLAGLVATAPHGVSLRRWAVAEGRDEGALPLLPDTLRTTGVDGGWAWAGAYRDAAGVAALDALRAFHARRPDDAGLDAAQLRRIAMPRLPEPLGRALLDTLRANGSVAVRGAFVQLPEHAVRLTAADQRLAGSLQPLLAQAGFDGRWARDLAREAHEAEMAVRLTLTRLAQAGELHQVVKDLFYPVERMAALAALLREVADRSNGVVTAAGFRDASGLGRKRAIQLLEYFDHLGLLRRVGDEHRLRRDNTLFVADAVGDSARRDR